MRIHMTWNPRPAEDGRSITICGYSGQLALGAPPRLQTATGFVLVTSDIQHVTCGRCRSKLRKEGLV